MTCLRFFTGDGVELTPVEQSLYGTNDVVRQMVRSSIRRFVAEQREFLLGRVLDYGCGRLGTCAIPSPYRSMLMPEDYVGWDLGDAPLVASPAFEAILCTQVLQHADDPQELLREFYQWLAPGGALVLTAPGMWEEIEAEKWRFTVHGLWALAHRAGFEVHCKRSLCSVSLDGSLRVSVVNGIVARKADGK